MADKPEPRYQVKETRRSPWKYMVLDTETGIGRAFSREEETAVGWAQELNTKGFIEI